MTPPVRLTADDTDAQSYARAMDETGASIGEALVDVKNLVRTSTGADEPTFTPKVVGWDVAGFFAGMSKSE